MDVDKTFEQKMDKIPLQTLKHHDKVSSEDLINKITVECASVRRNFKPTVRTRREFEPDDAVDFDTEFEKELIKVESAVDNVHLKETLPKIEEELNRWVHQYKDLLHDYSKLHDDSNKDQVIFNYFHKLVKNPLKKSIFGEVKTR